MTLQQLCDRAIGLVWAGQAAEAEGLFFQILDAEPGNVLACQELGVIRFQQGRCGEALEFFDRAAAIRPDFANLSNRGAALQMLHRYDEALASYDRALALQPQNDVLLYNRGRTLQELGRFEEALANYQQSLHINPNSVAALNNCGNTLRALKRYPEALAHYDRALALMPGNAETLYNRGDMQWAVNGNYAAAVRDLETAVALNPDYNNALGTLLYLRMHGGDWRDFDALTARINAGVRAGRQVVQPFQYQAVSDSPGDLQACAVIFTKRYFPPVAASAPATARRSGRIRLGYVAGEFREHATAHLAAGLFEQHDRQKFEVIAFDNGWDDGSVLRKRLESGLDKIVDISKLADRAAAEAIRAEEIDILVNLNGYVGLHRMGVFAQRAAPVQVNYLGFPGTTGASYMDYILADRIVIPEREEKFYTEKVVTLPDSYQVNDSRRAIAQTVPSRADCGLPEKAFVFCSFNSSYKLTPAVFAVWMNILRQTQGSVLWLLESNPDFAANLRRTAVTAGLAPERLVFAPMIAPDRHLARMRKADLFLDLLPCGAHTTASDALWAGLPLLTCRGGAFPGRVAASLLRAVGLPELITENFDDYQAMALRLGRDPVLLSSLKQKLAQNRLKTTLFDTRRFRDHVESAFAAMWEIFRHGEAPRSFAVPVLDKSPGLSA